MATQPHNDRKDPKAPTPTGKTTKENDAKPVEGKDPDLYNPVGMAGQKAGIVQEIEQELKQEAHDQRPDTDRETPTSSERPSTPTGPKPEQV